MLGVWAFKAFWRGCNIYYGSIYKMEIFFVGLILMRGPMRKALFESLIRKSVTLFWLGIWAHFKMWRLLGKDYLLSFPLSCQQRC